MANLIVDDSGRPLPQYQNKSTGNMEALKGSDGGMDSNVINEVLIKSAPEANQSDSLKVKVTAALPAGTNKIGSVDLASPIPTGSNLIGNVGIQGALPTGTNTIGKITADALGAIADAAVTNPASSASIVALLKGLLTKWSQALPAGDNNIGNVDVASLPALPAGTNNIGDVDVVSLPALPTGSNTIGKVDVNAKQFTPVKITLEADTPYEVKASAGYVAKIESSLNDVILRNDDTEVWGELGKVDFSTPIYLSSKIVLVSATGGTVYISYL